MIKKFRVMIEGTWCNVRRITFASEDNLYVYVDSYDPEIEEYEHQVSQSDLKQFTGWFDRNNKEIYEGAVVGGVIVQDIFDTPPYEIGGIVKYCGSSFMVVDEANDILHSLEKNWLVIE